MKRATIWAYAIALCAAAAVIALYYLQLPLLESIEARTWDSRLRLLQSARPPLARIALVAIDEKSIAEIGRFPWSREVYARFIDAVRVGGARAAFLDLLFPEPESRDRDELFATAMKRYGKVFLAESFEFDPQGGNATVQLQSIPALRNAARGSGNINLFPDNDGVIRWSMLSVPYGGKEHLSLALRGAMEILGENSGVTMQPYSITVAGKRIPTDELHRMLINYSASTGVIETFSFCDILNNRIPPARLNAKVLFVGSTASGIYDMRVTPLSSNTPGVLLHAIMADSIAQGSYLRRGGAEAVADLAAIILLSFLTAALLIHLKHAVSLPLLAVLATGHILACFGLLKAGSWVSITYPLTAMGLTFAGSAFVRFQLLDRHAREIRSLFSHFVSAKVVDQLVKNPDMVRIRGDSRIVTLLFADVRNYTSFSERHSPQEIVAVLNLYLSEMVSIVMEYDGTLDKFMGDGILAYWNAPLDQDNHAELAVRCAMEMIRRGDLLRERIAQECGEPLAWGIGINTGEVVAGIIGSAETKMEYTVIGDNVNLTYRIQNLSRDMDCPIITRPLYELVKEIATVDAMEPVFVKGKELPLEVYALRGVKT